MEQLTGYIGTYDAPGHPGVYRFRLDGETGALSEGELFYKARSAKALALWSGRLAAPVEREGKAGMLLLDRTRPGVALDEVFYERNTACYAVWEAGRLYTANYHQGHVLEYCVKDDILQLVREIKVAPKAGCHQVLLHEGHLLVPCLEQDRVLLFDGAGRQAGELPFPAGSGPRHGVFDAARAWLYFITERSCEIHVFRVGPGLRFEREGRFPLPAHPGDAGAAIRLSEDGRFLYASVRGSDLLAVYRVAGGRLELIQQVPCGGAHPRDLVLAPGGRFLLAANRDSGSVACFPLDREHGTIGTETGRLTVPRPVALAFA